jgi:hypothetical protein
MVEGFSICQTAEIRRQEFLAESEHWRRSRQVERCVTCGKPTGTSFRNVALLVLHLLTGLVANFHLRLS